MKSIYENVEVKESIFDDEEEIIKQGAAEFATDWIEKYCITKNIKVQYNKKAGFKFWGDLIIAGFDGEYLPGYVNIGDVTGDIKLVDCKNLVSLTKEDGENFFPYTCHGNMTISHCDKITDLKGCPGYVRKNLTVTYNKSLRSLEGMPDTGLNDITILKNGKKFKKEEVVAKLLGQREPIGKLYV